MCEIVDRTSEKTLLDHAEAIFGKKKSLFEYDSKQHPQTIFEPCPICGAPLSNIPKFATRDVEWP